MTVKDWGNTDLSRQQQVAPESATSSISYSKLYLTIVAAILTAFFIMAVVSMIISAAMFNAVMSEFYPQTKPTAYQQQQNSSSLQRDLDKLANQTAQKAIEPFQKELDRQNKLLKQQAAAKSSDIQTCDFWLSQYKKEKSDRNKMHANSACKRAHGALWNGI